MPAIVRWLWLYGRIPDFADVPGCPGFAHLCGHQRDHEAVDCAKLVVARPRATLTADRLEKSSCPRHLSTTPFAVRVDVARLTDRNKLDPALVDDVVLGCVDPVGEAGGDIARAAALVAGFGDGVPGIQINRFCASGLDAVNFAAAEVMSGQHEMTIGGGAESMSRIGIGASGGAWPVDPSIAVETYFLPQGISADLIATKYGFSRDDVDAYAVESQKRAAKAWDEGRFKKSIVPIKDVNGLTILAKDEHMRPGTTMQTLAALQPSFVQMGEMAGFD